MFVVDAAFDVVVADGLAPVWRRSPTEECPTALSDEGYEVLAAEPADPRAQGGDAAAGATQAPRLPCRLRLYGARLIRPGARRRRSIPAAQRAVTHDQETEAAAMTRRASRGGHSRQLHGRSGLGCVSSRVLRANCRGMADLRRPSMNRCRSFRRAPPTARSPSCTKALMRRATRPCQPRIPQRRHRRPPVPAIDSQQRRGSSAMRTRVTAHRQARGHGLVAKIPRARRYRVSSTASGS